MAAGDVNVTIVENPTALTVSTALSAMVTTLSVSMNFVAIPIGMGKGILLAGIESP